MNQRNKLRVLHIGKYYPPYKGGMETLLEVLCRELSAAVDIEVLVSNTEPKTVTCSDNEIHVKKAATFFNYDNAPICPGMIREIQKTKADILHLHYPNPMGVLACLLSGFKGPIIVSYHADIVRQNPFTKPFECLLHHLLKRCAVIIGATENYLRTSPIVQPYHKKCQIIPYAISKSLLDQVDFEKVSAIRKQYGPNLLLSVGRLVDYKGLPYLVRAIQETSAKLLIIGDGPKRRELGLEIERLNLKDRVFLLGEVEDTTPFFHACDVFVLPSIHRAEAFGIVQLEAMACGKPVINTQIDSGVPFVSLHEVTGLTVPPKDPQALAGAINRLMENEPLRKKYGEAGRKRVETEFNLHQMTQKILNIYSAVSQSPRISSVSS